MTLPKVSLILFSYNQEQFVRDAAQSCLAQNYAGPLEIIFSDDCSTDDTFKVMQEIAAQFSGRHELILRGNAVNLGIGEHYNAAIASSTGELIFTAAGDDISLPNRVSKMVDVWLAAGKRPDLLTSDLQQMSINGEPGKIIEVDDLAKWSKPEQWVRKRPYIVGAAHAFSRRLHVSFGGFIPGIVYEDQVMAFRATLLGGGLKVKGESLVKYREGGVSQHKKNIENAAAFMQWSWVHHSRHLAQYQQIYNDLQTKNRLDLWRGKIMRRHHESEVVMKLHQEKNWWLRLKLTIFGPVRSIIFRLRQFVLLTFPNFATNVQKVQRQIKQ